VGHCIGACHRGIDPDADPAERDLVAGGDDLRVESGFQGQNQEGLARRGESAARRNGDGRLGIPPESFGPEIVREGDRCIGIIVFEQTEAVLVETQLQLQAAGVRSDTIIRVGVLTDGGIGEILIPQREDAAGYCRVGADREQLRPRLTAETADQQQRERCRQHFHCHFLDHHFLLHVLKLGNLD
jgi:hypothetical protein